MRRIAVTTTFLFGFLTINTAVCPAEVPLASKFGVTKSGERIMEYSLSNKNGMQVKLITLGATVTEILAPGRNGNLDDVVLGFDDVAGYESDANQYFGCTVGRYANRIASGRFELDGKEYQLAQNDGDNCLHGGKDRSFDKVIWNAEPIEQGVRFTYTSPNGEENFPGELSTTVTYTLSDNNELKIDYSASSDQRTPVNLCNHSYFNLKGAGQGDILDHIVKLHASQFTPVDDGLIPTGTIEEVTGSPLDFTSPKRIGQDIDQVVNTPTKGYDHNFVLDDHDQSVRLVAEVTELTSGRKLEVLTDQPGIQFYTGNFLFNQPGKNGKKYAQRGAFCLETQHYPDSVNHPKFPSVILNSGEEYQHTCVYRFSITED
ncbi:aldose epimerase family protein [Calycomorphotria hydatis]|uniref:aldose epimerase family protein n=1 Tax=Calycomorphotria hydatis TaxID=2528027 RepID=UPI0036F26654